MKPVKFSFLVHPRNMGDIKINYPFLKYIPDIVLELLLVFAPPIKLATITGLQNKNGETTEGSFIGILLSARGMLLLPKFFVKRRIVQMVKLARRDGVELIGLGMFTSPLSSGGLDLVGKYGVGITNGNALTASVSIDGIDEIIRIKKINIEQKTIAIIGATGSVGSAVSKGMVTRKPHKIILLGRTPENLEKLRIELKEDYQSASDVITSTRINDIREADIIINATASNETFIKSEHLKEGAIVYDVAQPQNVAKELKEHRKDVLVISGGLVVGVPGIAYDFNIGLPENTYFACLTETMVLALEGRKGDFSVGKVSYENVLAIKELAEKNNFKFAELKNWDKDSII